VGQAAYGKWLVAVDQADTALVVTTTCPLARAAATFEAV